MSGFGDENERSGESETETDTAIDQSPDSPVASLDDKQDDANDSSLAAPIVEPMSASEFATKFDPVVTGSPVPDSAVSNSPVPDSAVSESSGAESSGEKAADVTPRVEPITATGPTEPDASETAVAAELPPLIDSRQPTTETESVTPETPTATVAKASAEEVAIVEKAAAADVETSAAEPVVAAPAVVESPEVETEATSATGDAPAPELAEPAVEIGESADGAVVPPGVTDRTPGAPGRIVEGVVTAVTADYVELTLDDGRPAVITRRNFGLNNEEPSAVLSVDDRAFGVELTREDPKSRIVLSRSWALKKQAWDKVAESAEKGELVNGRIVSGSAKGVVVDCGVRGFVPMSHFLLESTKDLEPYVDQSFDFKILEFDRQREKLVLSRRSMLMKAQRQEAMAFLTSLKPGEIRKGRVSSFADYGVFVDLGGANGLIHISELSWERVKKPTDVLSVGEEVEVKILDVKPKKKRIGLSLRQTTPDPLSVFEVGTVLNGMVTRLVDFGAFVSVEGFEGLVHLSELAEYRVSAPEEIVTPGDSVGVKVMSVDKKRRRLELSIRRAAEYLG